MERGTRLTAGADLPRRVGGTVLWVIAGVVATAAAIFVVARGLSH